MIAIGIKNLTSNKLYVKESQYIVLPNQTFFIGEYDFFDLAKAQSLKDLINAGSAVIIRDGVQFSAAASIIYLTTPSTGGSGEANTASNVGLGAGVFKQKTGVDLEFKSFTAGSNITITPSADEIQISATGGSGEVNTASNVGTGAGQVFKQKTGVDLELKTIKAGTNITVTNNADDITIDAAGGGGEVNTASNLGAGEGVFAQKTGVDLEFKSLVAGTNISLTGTANDITINSTAEQFYLERTETIDNATAVDVEYFTLVQGGTEISNVINVTGGDYWFEFSFVCFNTSRNGRVIVNPQVNSIDVFSQTYKREPKDINETFYESISKRVTLSAGANTIQLQLSNDGSGTARIYEANVQITKV